MSEPVPMPTEEERRALVPDYETDPAAVGQNRKAIDPDGDKHWTEVHGLSPAEANAFVAEVLDASA